jgi:hypothetical protein
LGRAIRTSGELATPHPKDGHLREVRTMIDFRTAKILGHRRNIQRYARLLAGELTELERQYLHKRIAEEHAELERLQESQPQQAGALTAAEDMGKGSGAI